MWADIIFGLLIVLALLLLAGLVYSFIRTAGGTRYDLFFYEKDKCCEPGAVVKRTYKSPGHFFYRLKDTLRYLYPVFRVYLLRALSGKFREKIMITTAMANRCER